VRPLLTCTAETWAMTINEEGRLEYPRKENPSQNIWSNMRERAVTEEIQ